MKALKLAVGLLAWMLGPAAYADTCNVTPPAIPESFANEAERQTFIIQGRRYLQAASTSDNLQCLDDARKFIAPLTPSSVGELKLPAEDARELQRAVQFFGRVAAEKREQAEHTLSSLGSAASPQDSADAKTKLNQTITQTAAQAANARAAEAGAKQAVAAFEAAIADGARYSIYFGPAYTLTPDGSWNSGIDTVFRSETAPKGPFRGYFQLSYTTRSGPKTEDGEPEENAPPGGTPPEFVSPFVGEGGVVNIQTGGNFMPFSGNCQWLGLSLRGGYESLPSEKSSSDLNTFKPFASAGLVTRTIYDEQTSLGQIFLGYSHDLRWNKDLTGESKNRYERFVFSGLLELFQVEKATIATRLSASMPITGKGDTEFRISILLGFKLQDIANTLGTP